MTDPLTAPAPLRVGVVSDSTRQPSWVAHVFRELGQMGVVSLAVLAVGDRKSHALVDAEPSLPGWLWRLYARLDDRMFRNECQPDACGVVDLGSLAKHVMPVGAPVGEETLDVVIQLGGSSTDTDLIGASRLGAWFIQHGTCGDGLVEFVHRRAVTRTRLLQRHSVVEPGRLVAESWSATDLKSLRRHRNRLGWKAAALLRRALEHAWRSNCGSAAGAPESATDEAESPAPNGSGGVAFLPRFAWNVARDKLRDRVFIEQWGIGLAVGGNAPLIDQAPQRYLIPPKDRFWADPFPFEHKGRRFVFVEEVHFRENRGYISVLEVDSPGTLTAAPVIQEPYHLSYPSVFKWRDDVFMTPESSAARRVDLYKARSFPGSWEKVGVLLDGMGAADPTILHLDGVWWMFVNLPLAGASNYDECHLFWADRLEGPWQPHACNPIRSDVRCARPAGRLFFEGGKLYRPAQDCSERYGYATVIHEVLRMSRTEYREREVSRILPVWRDDIVATHTLNRAGDLTTWDCLFVRARWAPFASSAVEGGP